MAKSFLSHMDSALRNRNSVLHYLKAESPVYRTIIGEKMGMSRASVTQIIHQLMEDNLVLEIGNGESSGGRKPVLIRFNESAKKLYAFDWQLRQLCLLDMAGNVCYECTLPMEQEISPEDFAATIQAGIAKIDAMGLCNSEDIIGFGLSLPGMIECQTGTVVYASELQWRNVNVRKMFEERFGDMVYVERNTNVMALSEYHYGSGEDISHFQLFMLGTSGIGMSAVVHGHCQHGANFMYGEVGHIKLANWCDGQCSFRNLEDVAKELYVKNGNTVTEDFLECLAVGISTSVNISDANRIVLLGGYISNMLPQQRELLREKILQKVTGRYFRKLDVCFSEEQQELFRRGVSTLVFDNYYSIHM